MSETPRAYLTSILYDPQTKLVDRVVVVVEFAHETKRINIDLEPLPLGDPGISNQAAQILRGLSEDFRHIEDVPLTSGTRHLFRS